MKDFTTIGVSLGMSHREYTLEAENFALRQKLANYKGLVTAIRFCLENTDISRSALVNFIGERLSEIENKELFEEEEVEEDTQN